MHLLRRGRSGAGANCESGRRWHRDEWRYERRHERSCVLRHDTNVDEDHLIDDNEYVQQVRELAEQHNAEFVKLCAKLEEDMAGLTDAERQEYLTSMGVEESGLEQVIHHGYHALGLISFFTAGPKEVRAWTVRSGARAPEAAGVIHTDFERGFIRAEVIPYATYVRLGTETAAKSAGEMRVEGKEYVVQDGDVMHFRFNV